MIFKLPILIGHRKKNLTLASFNTNNNHTTGFIKMFHFKKSLNNAVTSIL